MQSCSQLVHMTELSASVSFRTQRLTILPPMLLIVTLSTSMCMDALLLQCQPAGSLLKRLHALLRCHCPPPGIASRPLQLSSLLLVPLPRPLSCQQDSKLGTTGHLACQSPEDMTQAAMDLTSARIMSHLYSFPSKPSNHNETKAFWHQGCMEGLHSHDCAYGIEYTM